MTEQLDEGVPPVPWSHLCGRLSASVLEKNARIAELEAQLAEALPVLDELPRKGSDATPVSALQRILRERDDARADLEDLLARSCATTEALGKDWRAGEELHATAVTRLRLERDRLVAKLAEVHAAIGKRASHGPAGNAACVIEWIEDAKTTLAEQRSRISALEAVAASVLQNINEREECPLCSISAVGEEEQHEAGRPCGELDRVLNQTETP